MKYEEILKENNGDCYPLYENGEIIGYIPSAEIVDTDTWGGARIGKEWQIGHVEIDGKEYPLMNDGNEHYVVWDF